ncbi:uncharacterized protein LOC134835062 [Culicoides brevitarsis]|uniref:uncharacterized protein LOC134835062 n=1 Tax=Culicoides brevitarsis TaxID=469753 RepID=UPI00307C0376
MWLRYITFLLCSCLYQGITSLKMIKFSIPPYKLRMDSALLECQFEMNGKPHSSTYNTRNHHSVYEQHFGGGGHNYDSSEQGEEETLYSVKFYKDNEEFYRFMPKASPPQHSYRVEGIKVDHTMSDSSRVMLRALTLKSSGLYRCEISAEAPSFASVQAEGRMEVVFLPKDGPHISGEQQQQYQIGDYLNLNCTSGKSHPASVLQWYINDQPVTNPDYLIEYPPIQHSHGLITTALGLSMTVEPRHFNRGTMHVKCVGDLAPVLWQKGRESVVQRRPDLIDAREAMLLGTKAYME